MKYTKIIAWNIALTIILFIVADFMAFMIIDSQNPIKDGLLNKLKYYTKIIPNKSLEKNLIISKALRKIENKNSNKEPIIVFGCSYANGAGLKRDKTFSARLGQITKRPIYNRAMSGMGPQYTYYQVSNDKFYNIVPKPEYVIYVYIQSHIPRMYMGGSGYLNRYIYYKKNNSDYGKKLKRDYFREIFARPYLIYNLNIENKNKISENPTIKDLSLLKLYFLEIKKEMESRWGNDFKFVILLYEKESYINKIRPIFPELEKNGIEIIDINKLSNINFKKKEYQISDNNPHPNEKAWEEITPLVVNKLGL